MERGSAWRRWTGAIWDIWRAERSQLASLQAYQAERLRAMITYVRQSSLFYRDLYRHCPAENIDLRQLPIVTKSGLMTEFDRWVTDPEVTRAGLEAFVAGGEQTGRLFLERYLVWATSGVTGEPGIFLHDSQAQFVYGALAVGRGLLKWMPLARLLTFLRGGGRSAAILATGGHFAGVVLMEHLRSSAPWLHGRLRAFSIQQPFSELVQALNEYQPVVLISYPTVLNLLAREAQSGRLKIKPLLMITVAEWISEPGRQRIAQSFGCPLWDCYAASEFMGIAYSCRLGRNHLNADWVIMEPVDEKYNPLPLGQVSHTVLLTNLVNRVQPLIRYDLGDSLLIEETPCPCGNPLPVVRVQGRRDEILFLSSASGVSVPLLPMALAAVVEEIHGVRRFQIIQRSPTALSVRLLTGPGSNGKLVWETVNRHLKDYMAVQGLSSVRLERDPQAPARDPVSGKYCQVWVDLMGN